MTAQVKVEILGDAKGVKKAFGEAGKSVGGFQSVVSTAAGVMGGILGAALLQKGLSAAGDLIKDGISNASDLSEQTSKLGQVFGKAAGGVDTWSKSTAKALGLSERQSKTAASNFGVLLQSQGMGAKGSADWSKRLTTLAADMASFNNADISDTITAINAGLRGESEPLRKYGVNLSDAALKAEAMRKGLYKGKGPLSDRAKQTAALGLIMKNTAKQQGDFARTSDGLANTQRTNAAVMEEVGTKIGTMVLPAVTALAKFVGDKLLPALSDMADQLGPALAPILAAVGPIIEKLGTTIMPILADAVAKIAPIFGMLASTILPALSGALDKILPIFADLAPLASELGATVMPILADALGRLPALLAAVTPLFDALASNIIPVFTTVMGILAPIVATIGGFIADKLLPAIIEVAGALSTALVPIVAKIAPLFAAWAPWIGFVVGVLVKVAGVVLEALVPALKIAIDVVGTLLGIFLDIFTAVGKLMAVFATFAGPIIDKLLKSLSGLVKVGVKIVQGIVDGIKSMAGEVVKAILGLLPGPLKDAVGGIIGVHSTSPAAMGARATGGTYGTTRAAASGPITVNLYTTGDSLSTERAVLRAVRRATRLNGGTLPAWAAGS